MSNKKYMKISEFARLTGINRANLIFYDKIGLLSPELRGDNDYRYYGQHQLSNAYLIGELRELGIGIDEIKQYILMRSPKRMLELFSAQEKRIEAELSKLRRVRDMMRLHSAAVSDVLANGEERILLRVQEEASIFVGRQLSPHEDMDEAVVDFFSYIAAIGIEPCYPLGSIVSADSFLNGSTDIFSRFYLVVKSGGNAKKPAGKYAVIYSRCGLGNTRSVYSRLNEYIKANGLFICGDVYEEYPLNEISTANEDDYCVKLEVMVR